MRFIFFIICSVFLFQSGRAQAPTAKWWVEFTDKNNSPYCTCRPAEFLSAKALDRRAKNGIAIEDNDLPVNPAYLTALREKGARVHSSSRWLNAAAVIADSATARRLQTLPFVRSVAYVGRDIRVKNSPNQAAKKRVVTKEYPVVGENPFGYAARQNSLLGTPLLYANGHRGKDIWIAVMDGGFTNADDIPLFDSVALQGRLFQGWDFVEHDSAVYESASHGTGVLSVMAGNLPGYFVGTAPEATYFLIKTEDTGGEFPIEECNWIAGAEWADSLGVDLINASLGYTVFNDTTLGHRTWELDGRRSIGARGASIAVGKGMIICNSAGNSGDEAWRFVGVPADARGIVSVGSVDFNGERSTFSSLGPTADGRIKPDLMAPGDGLVTAGYSGLDLGISSGTSLASPMLTGAIASLWSAFPQKTAKEILDAVFASADQIQTPDNERGYGLPNMSIAWLMLDGYWWGGPNRAGDDVLWSFDRKTGVLSLVFLKEHPQEPFAVHLYNVLGQEIKTNSISFRDKGVFHLEISGLEQVPAGYYHVVVADKERVFNLRILGF